MAGQTRHRSGWVPVGKTGRIDQTVVLTTGNPYESVRPELEADVFLRRVQWRGELLGGRPDHGQRLGERVAGPGTDSATGPFLEIVFFVGLCARDGPKKYNFSTQKYKTDTKVIQKWFKPLNDSIHNFVVKYIEDNYDSVYDKPLYANVSRIKHFLINK